KTLEEPPSYAIFILATTEKHKILPTILSRCQIFDFNRIQTRDIADHLAQIAQKEGIATEREALELIGQKADGGLRDALSMFDLNVTFSPNNALTYADVLENLHILDYDYYFRITDALLNGSIASALLLFDEIVRKGFDGHLFVIGLLEHFRNLMVSKDPSTIQLLEVSEGAQVKYLDQSQRTDLGFLLSALSIGSQCDIHYKTSKNQRLHVELCLMKLAKLPDVLSLSGLDTADSQGETVKKKAEPELSVSTESAPAYGTKPSGPGSPAANGTTGAAPIPSGSRLRSTAHISASALPATPVPPPVRPSESQAPALAEKKVFQKVPLSFENLSRFWTEYAEKRKEERDSSIEEITLNREFTLSDQTIDVALDNDLQKDTLTALRHDLIGFLRERIDAPTLSLEFRVAPQEVKRMPYTAAEKFKYLIQKNPHLEQLQQVLGLDTDF
ncbi:MAG: DNA polymerase III subunit gamma/tau, partial [Bacteroidetes bacterium]|nr:DNA polymerase III subunit gamma/tau [Bacteroidota bacterium]